MFWGGLGFGVYKGLGSKWGTPGAPCWETWQGERGGEGLGVEALTLSPVSQLQSPPPSLTSNPSYPSCSPPPYPRGCTSHLLPGLPQWVSLCLSQLEAPALTHPAMPAANNAAWALGELLMRSPPDAVAAHAERVSASLHFILSGGVRVTHGLKENAAITMGRVAAQAPAALAPHLGHFLSPWCSALKGVRDEVEKEDAFRGLCRLVPLNVEAAWNAFPQLAGGGFDRV